MFIPLISLATGRDLDAALVVVADELDHVVVDGSLAGCVMSVIDHHPWYVLVGRVQSLCALSDLVVVLHTLGAVAAGVDVVPVEAQLRSTFAATMIV